MYMRAGQSSRMRPVEFLDLNFARRGNGSVPAGSFAQICFSAAQFRDTFQSDAKRLGHGRNDLRKVRRQRIGVDGGDEHRLGAFPRNRGFAEWTRAEGRPEAGFDQQRLDGGRLQLRGRLAGKRGELREFAGGRIAGLFAFGQIDDDRQQRALLAAVNRRHFARAGGRKAHALALLVGKERLAALDNIADLHKKRRLQTRVIGGGQARARDRRGGFDALLGRAGDRQIEAFGKTMKSHGASQTGAANGGRAAIGSNGMQARICGRICFAGALRGAA
ncbi:MAG: hypothetical protein BWZ10_00729 [candidate division BRC1 bacterium ADurb.BinA364]|nr:MAG: hypothetical protein BWZ10_00729 [candidate division BRC1 bacterium ADurb.BinA364]